MSRRRERWALCVLSALVGGSALPARAHPGPAETPEFGPPECILVVDTQKTQVFPIQYFLGFDDTLPEPDHISLPDSKTHQFYAFRGQIYANDPDYFLYPFDPALPVPAVMPRWINQDDLTRSEQANTPMIAPDFSAAAIGGDTLTQRMDMLNQWQLVTQMRVPITVGQSRAGARWDLRTVQPGVYQIATYVFSPPYTAWEPRPGVVKVTDGVRDLPAVTLDPVDASLFAGQGRKITGCVNAPSGTQLRAWSRPAGDPTAPWQMWATEPLKDGAQKFELCFRNALPGRSGLLNLRVTALSPSGEETAAYALDQLSLVAKEAACTESAKLCCDMTQPSPPAVTANAQMAEPTPPAGVAMQPMVAGAPALVAAIMATPQPATSAGGCTVGVLRTAGVVEGWAWLGWLCGLALTRRRTTQGS